MFMRVFVTCTNEHTSKNSCPDVQDYHLQLNKQKHCNTIKISYIPNIAENIVRIFLTFKNITIHLSLHREMPPFTRFHLTIKDKPINKVYLVYDEFLITNVFLYIVNFENKPHSSTTYSFNNFTFEHLLSSPKIYKDDYEITNYFGLRAARTYKISE
ncbi:hypothetical protein RF11_02658 [Thelohanellus kitauei]|uniref:Uncharacterized protein n=1 Tax=Thelohanellus kitauei TaxID=669202 RepID=A0A0C2N3E3_THEKT|nr:hypothetical protein RF11_02658 [Thelohanellus kitauei]